METKLKSLSFGVYLAGAALAVLSLLGLPFTHKSDLWDLNLGVAMFAVGAVLATAVLSAVALLSKNFPTQLMLVLGTSLLVSTAGLLIAQNAALVLVQQISLLLLALFVVSRLLIEFVINKPKTH
jgi:hypothetical protein